MKQPNASKLTKSKKLNTTNSLLTNPCKAKRGWDVSQGRKWVLVAFWGTETTVTFHHNEDEANEAYEDATGNGADAFYAKTCRMMLQSDPAGLED